MAETFMDRFRKGLERTRDILNADVEDLARGRRPLKPEDLDQVEERLIAADLGLPATQQAAWRRCAGSCATRSAPS